MRVYNLPAGIINMKKQNQTSRHARVIWEEGTSNEGLPPSDWPVERPVSRTFSWLVIVVWGPSPLWMVPALGRWFLGYIRKKAEEAMESKPVNSVPPWLLPLPLLERLPWLPLMTITDSSPPCFWPVSNLTAEKQTRTETGARMWAAAVNNRPVIVSRGRRKTFKQLNTMSIIRLLFY